MAIPEPSDKEKQIVKRCMESVVQVSSSVKTASVTGFERGSGLLWDQTERCWYIVTSSHCVPEGRTEYVVTFAKEYTFKATVVARRPDLDTAVLRIDPFNWKIKPVVQPSKAELYPRKPVTIIGYPDIMPCKAVIDGKICALAEEPVSLECGASITDAMVISGAVTKGFSGGGAFNGDGRLLGMICAAWLNSCCNSPKGFGVAIPVKSIVSWVGEMIQDDKKDESLRFSCVIDIDAGVGDLVVWQATGLIENGNIPLLNTPLLHPIIARVYKT